MAKFEERNGTGVILSEGMVENVTVLRRVVFLKIAKKCELQTSECTKRKGSQSWK
jgi:hypothetical protein